jgi:hypothetical protein
MKTRKVKRSYGSQFTIIRKNDLVEIWMPPVGHPEGVLVAVLNSILIPDLIADLKKFEQSEGRK